ncbi:MFS transporter [Sphingobacterium siyangense]|uniref:MFS transporter n=1 Tax=Sphingobacterium siyangense TaxID=459529 RepID=A0A562M8J8_9SPHI|nr:MFS transporter [Sphingobacterium siyangense]
MTLHLQIFKPWVSEWLARSIIFAVLMTSLFSFSLYSSNTKIAATFYGVDQLDIQYSVVLLYAVIVIFLTLDLRIIKYFRVKDYLIFGLALNILSYIVCFYVRDWGVFLACRIIQGIVCSLLCNIVLNLTFARLHPSRAKLIGYAVFYGGLQTSGPICAIYSTHMLEYFNFNYLFAGLIVASIPVWLLVWITFNSAGRFSRKVPLYHFDWVGLSLYCYLCLIISYISVYGKFLKWFDNFKVIKLSVLLLITAILFTIRELRYKHPLIELRTLKVGNFKAGLLLLTFFYVFKGTIGLTYVHLEVVLGVSPVNMVPIWLANITGICIGLFTTARLLIMGKPIINLVIMGFSCLTMYFIYMLALLSSKGEVYDFVLPLFFFGLATGTLIVPLVIFTLGALPLRTAFNGSLLGIFARYLGFCLSIMINNQLLASFRSPIINKVETQPMLVSSIRNYYSIIIVTVLIFIVYLITCRAIKIIKTKNRRQ